jgi:predicted NAD/FAD-binding protein
MRIGIVGGGISGLVAAHRLAERHKVTVFEANRYIGGHTNTIDVEDPQGAVAVDTGFIVFNDRTYPGFCKFLDDLGVRSQPTEMSFSVRDDADNLEYRGMDLAGLFAQRRNVFRPRFWKLLRDFVRFRDIALQLADDHEEITVGQFFQQNSFSEWFIHKYFLPMGSAVWSCPRATFETFPIRFIIDFYRNHGMLGVQERPRWHVVSGGSREYVRALLQRLDAQIHLECPVQSVHRRGKGVDLAFAGGRIENFDHVVLACHADQALRMVGGDATATETELLSKFPYERNEVVLHTDVSLLPRRRKAWASWNYWVRGSEDEKASVTYNMNILQGLNTEKTYCVTLNDTSRIDPQKVLRSFVYDHPVFQAGRSRYQGRHEELIDLQHISYCGAYWANGFHEDGVQSALRVARILEKKESACGAESTRGGSIT